MDVGTAALSDSCGLMARRGFRYLLWGEPGWGTGGSGASWRAALSSATKATPGGSNRARWVVLGALARHTIRSWELGAWSLELGARSR
jgi:hypothetical protein